MRNNVATAIDVLQGFRNVGQAVIIVGGGLVGCETAEFLAHKGKDVTIFEMLDRIGSDIGPLTRWVTRGRLQHLGVKMVKNARVEQITGKGVKANLNGETVFLKADSVVLAVGMVSNLKLAKELQGKAKDLYVIGDSSMPGNIAGAIESAFTVAHSM